MTIKSALWAAVFAVLSVSSAAAETPMITVLYKERAPYAINTAQGPIGFVSDPISRAFDKAGIRLKWEELPFNRHLVEVKANNRRVCAAGWFNRPERQEMGRFTQPIYQDQPTAILGRRNDARLMSATSLRDVIRDRDLHLLVKSGFSYGPVIDSLLETHKPDMDTTTVDNETMARLVSVNRYDYFFISYEEGEYLLSSIAASASNLTLYSNYSGVPDGNTRHLICSFQIDQMTIDRLNAAISQDTVSLADIQ